MELTRRGAIVVWVNRGKRIADAGKGAGRWPLKQEDRGKYAGRGKKPPAGSQGSAAVVGAAELLGADGRFAGLQDESRYHDVAGAPAHADGALYAHAA